MRLHYTVMTAPQTVALAGMAVSGGLAVLKIFAGLNWHSTAVVADGFESAADVIASGFVWVGMTLAAKPPDEKHPYGHGRLEILTGLIIGLALAVVGGLLAYRAVDTLGEMRSPPRFAVIWPLVLSAAAKSGLSGLKFHFGRKFGSAALIADAWNDFVDVFSAVAALAAVSLALFDPARFLAADHWGAFLVGLIVIFTGGRVIRDTGMQLIDTMPDDDQMREVRCVALQVPGVRGVEKCFARKTGLRYHVDLHMEVDPEITVRASHEMAHEVRDRIMRSLDWVADVLVHVEPAP
jgi:cation diffusion facilitator family transporter